MNHLKKFNEEIYFRGGEPTSKFYWLSDKDPRDGDDAYTIGKYSLSHKDGSGGPFWELIASDEYFTDEELRQNFVVMSEIPFTNK